MQLVYQKHMRALWRLAGEIGTLGEDDSAYAIVYEKLSEALDKAELLGLIADKADKHKRTKKRKAKQ